MKTKRAILTTVLLSLFMWTYSQLVYDDKPHLMFNNVPMNGTVTTFAEKLGKQGFKITNISSGGAELEGSIFNKECTLTAFGTEKTFIVYKVSVYFANYPQNWQESKKNYLDFKKILQTKYGVGASSESFTAPYKEGDGREMEALRKYKCNFSTIWKSDSGEIWLFMYIDGEYGLIYTDKTNAVIYSNETTATKYGDEGDY